MSTRVLARRIAHLEDQEALTFAAFLLNLSPADMRIWTADVLATLARTGVIDPPPAGLWDRPRAERAAFLRVLRTQIAGGYPDVTPVLRHACQAWEREHTR